MSHHQPAWRDVALYRSLRWLLKPAMRLLYGYESHNVRPRAKNYLLLCNHQTLLDPVLLGADFVRHMYFVASEHVVRRRGGGLIKALTNPILRTKARVETDTALDVLRHLRKGRNVCIFIEGECTYDGVTGPIADSASHLAKLSGAALVTYTLHGGYFAHPRWGKGRRPGKVWGELRGEYPPEQIQAMSQAEVQQLIEADLYIDAYAEQQRLMIPYHGRTPAEDLETALFVCPACNRIGSLHSQGDSFSCACGLSLRYDAYGFFQAGGSAPPFPTVQAWYAWQKAWLLDYAAKAADIGGPLLADPDQTVLQPSLSRRFQADVALYHDCLTLSPPGGEKIVLPLAEIKEISCHERMRVSFIHNALLYELLSPYPRSGLKYQLLFRALKAQA